MITIVSGLPRSGTSMMMMRMLEAGGMEVITDQIRQPDEDNPRGYYEFEQVKKIQEDCSWLQTTKGTVFKMVSQLLYYLPPEHTYKIIFMHRNLKEILLSQKRMLERRGQIDADISDEEMGEIFKRHLMQIEHWLSTQKNIEILHISYNEILEHPIEMAENVKNFLGKQFDVRNMVNVVDKSLYRQKEQLISL